MTDILRPVLRLLTGLLLITLPTSVRTQSQFDEARGAIRDAREAIARGDFAAALAPAERALEFQDGRLTQDPLFTEAAAAAALAITDPQSANPQDLHPLIMALTRAEETGAPPGPVLWSGWTFVATQLEQGERWLDANLAADRAIGLLGMMDDSPVELRQTAALAGARAAINLGNYDVAAWRYAWAASALAPVSSSSATDPVWADLFARAHAARAAHLSLNRQREPLLPPVAAPQDAASPRCAPQWIRSPGGRRSVGRSGRRPGAALIEFEIQPNGETTEPVVLAIVPTGEVEFGEQAEAAARRWRADPATLEGCDGVKYVTPFIFVLD